MIGLYLEIILILLIIPLYKTCLYVICFCVLCNSLLIFVFDMTILLIVCRT